MRDDFRAGGFMFVFRPGALSEAPHTFIGFVKGPADADATGRVTESPDVTIEDLTQQVAPELVAAAAKQPTITAVRSRIPAPPVTR